MTYLIFETLEDAETAVAQIDINLGCPVSLGSYSMTRWAVPQETASGTFAFKKPTERAALISGIGIGAAIIGVAGYIEVDSFTPAAE